MALTRRNKKLSNAEVRKVTGRQYLVCSECNEEEVLVPADIGRVTCAVCVQKMLVPPTGYKKEKSDKPRGWHFREYFEHNGVTYSKGQEITDPDEIKALKKAAKKVATTTKSVVTKTTKKKSAKVTTPKVTRGRKHARSAK